MKNKIILPIVALMLLSSCASKFGLVKRKYNKGYYFSVSKNKNNFKKESEQKNVVVKNIKSNIPSIQKESSVDSNVEPVATIPSTQPIAIKTKKETAPIHSAKAIEPRVQLITSSQSKDLQTTIKKFKPIVNPILFGSKKATADDTNTILLVILCLFWWLNLVAVYLHDGKQITLNFWITLLLDITIIGGIIFSILVVLDIVNLA